MTFNDYAYPSERKFYDLLRILDDNELESYVYPIDTHEENMVIDELIHRDMMREGLI